MRYFSYDIVGSFTCTRDILGYDIGRSFTCTRDTVRYDIDRSFTRTPKYSKMLNLLPLY
jgi:hypothetical protein